MKFFIDTANIEEIKKAWDLGVLDGVTTNPSLISKEGKDPVKLFREICSIVNGPVSAEAVTLTADEMVKEARSLSKIHKNIVVKIPMIEEGLKAVKRLSAMGIKTNVTLIFSSSQALLAAKAGATYVSPFVGRLDDISHVGMDIVGDILDIYENYMFSDRSDSSKHSQPPPRCGRGKDGRPYRNNTVFCYNTITKAPSHGHRIKEVPEGLGKGAEKINNGSGIRSGNTESFPTSSLTHLNGVNNADL